LNPEIWLELERSLAPSSGLVERRLPVGGACELYIAVRKPGNGRLAIARVRGAEPSGVALPPQTRGISTALREGDGLQEVELALLNPAFAEIFDVLVADLERVLGIPAGASESLDALLRRIRVWQQFFSSAAPEGLGEEALRGIFGELWFLREQLVGAIGPERAVSSWKGPGRTDQDFQLPGCAVEVKTTGTKQPQRLAIASERQLDSTGVRSLVVCHVSVDIREGGGGETVPDIVRRVRSDVASSPSAAGEFEERLLAAGYSDLHAARYRDRGFTVRQWNLFEVREGFPRILEQDLPSGVGDVRYSVAVDSLQGFAVSPSWLREHILEGLT